MGQKVNPHALRLGVIYDWDSRYFNYEEDNRISAEFSEESTEFSDNADSSSD